MHEIEKNFQFLLVEVERQIEGTLSVIENHNESTIAKVEARDDYIDNLKSVIENACFATLHGESPSPAEIAQIRAFHIIANNLERVGDHAVNVVRQTRHYDDPECIKRYGYKPFFEEVLHGLEWTPAAVLQRDMATALKICRCELHLDRLYKQEFDRIRDELQSGFQTGDLLTTIFIFRYLERMGDALLNIGEAAIFGITGDKFKIRQFTALNDILAESGHENPLSDMEFESIWGTRSGCRIGRIVDRAEGGRDYHQEVIFKDGDTGKLRKEAANIARWETLMPGLPPRIQAFREDKKASSMLVELLPGQTIQDLALTGNRPLLGRALAAQRRLTESLWDKTRVVQAIPAGSMRQLRARLDEVLTVHPQFRLKRRGIGGCVLPSLDELITAASAVETTLAAPFSVFLHGDYNTNNILYDAANDRIHYIDLHRSADGDLVQDVSVYMISNFRLPVFDKPRRRLLHTIILEFFQFSRGYCERYGDATFDIRLALGLARSLITSTRFELSERFSKLMFQRGIYLLQCVAGHAGDPADFRLPLAAVCS